MPIQAPQWTEFLSCPICYHMFDETSHRPISLACGHTVCKICLSKLPQKICPFDQNAITRAVDELPVNFALLQLVGVAVPEEPVDSSLDLAENLHQYNAAKKCIEELAIFLKPLPQVAGNSSSPVSSSSSASIGAAPSPFLSRPMQRKLVSLVNCQLIEEEGRARAIKAARSLGERTVTEMILLHQNPQQLSANLWAAVRARGCQFLGPAMQEEVLKLILLALEDGSALSRKVLVLFVVQRLETQYPQASKTAIGHVVQLLYRASCFKVTKREEESSLMQLKEEFRTYEALRREHDSQIVQIATEAGLRISPEQWSSLLYGDVAHKSHMQSIIDKLQTPQSFCQSINELSLALQRTGDPGNLTALKEHLELLACVDPNAENGCFESWEKTSSIMTSVLQVVKGLLNFTSLRAKKGLPPDMMTQSPGLMPHNAKYKTSMCRDLALRGQCPRGNSCTFAHSHEEMERFRARSKKLQSHHVISSSSSSVMSPFVSSSSPKMSSYPSHSSGSQIGTCEMPVKQSALSRTLSPKERKELDHVTKKTQAQLEPARASMTSQAHIQNDTRTSSDSDAAVMSVNHCQTSPPLSAKLMTVQTNTSVNQSVTVPVAKPSALHGSTKQILGKKDGIYSSRTSLRNMEQQQKVIEPAITPTAKKLPTVMVEPNHLHQQQQQQQLQQQQIPTARQQNPELGQRMPAPGQHPVMPQAGIRVSEYSTAKLASEHQQPLTQSSLDSFMKSAVSMPPNPYTAFATNVKNKSPTEQLGDLQKRRLELLTRLNYSKNVIGDQSCSVTEPMREASVSSSLSSSAMNFTPTASTVLASSASSSSIVSSIASSIASSLASIIASEPMGGNFGPPYSSPSAQCSVTSINGSSARSKAQQRVSVRSLDGTVKSLSMSVADSVASSHLAMSFEGCHKHKHPEKIDRPCANPVYHSVVDDEEYHLMSDSVASSPCSAGWPQQLTEDDEYEEYGPLQSHLDDQDEFVPFEHTRVSKYGPISRKETRNRKYLAPTKSVNVTAGQARVNQDMIPVMAVTPNMQRPCPITSPVASRFTAPMTPNSQTDHYANPYGVRVAASLPTALLKPNVIAAASDNHVKPLKSDLQPYTLWALKEKMLSVSNGPALEPTQIQDELCDVSRRIQNLQVSEEERLSRELQAIEMNIQETKRRQKTNTMEHQDFLLAREEQEYEVVKEQEKKVQEAKDRVIAERIALEEAKGVLQ